MSVMEHAQVQVVEKDDVLPVCPYCTKELTELWTRPLEGLLGNRYVYFCPHCRKILGTSDRKGLIRG